MKQMGSIFFPSCVFFSPDGGASPDSNSLCNDYCQKSFPFFSWKTVLSIVPGKKYKCAMLFTFPKAISFEVQDHTSTPIRVKCLLYFWDISSYDTRF